MTYYAESSLTHPVFLKAQRSALEAWHIHADSIAPMSFGEWVDCFPSGRPLPGVDLTTSCAREDYLGEWLDTFEPEKAAELVALKADDVSPLEEVVDAMCRIEIGAVFGIDTLEDEGCLFPIHSCHWSVSAAAVLAKLEHPDMQITVVTNTFHSTVLLGDGSYFDLLTDQEGCEYFKDKGTGWHEEIDVTDLPLEDIAEAVEDFMALDFKDWVDDAVFNERMLAARDEELATNEGAMI